MAAILSQSHLSFNRYNVIAVIHKKLIGSLNICWADGLVKAGSLKVCPAAGGRRGAAFLVSQTGVSLESWQPWLA